MKEIMAAFDVQYAEDWQRVSASDIVEMGGRGFLYYYSTSVLKAIQELVPEHATDKCRPKVSKGHWHNRDNVIDAVKQIEHRLGISTLQGWQGCTNKDVSNAGGRAVLRFFGDSLQRMLAAAYPGQDVRPYLSTTPRGYWSSRRNRRDMLKSLELAFGINHITDWKRVSASDVRLVKNGPGFLQFYEGSIIAALRDLRAEEFEAMEMPTEENFWLGRTVEKPVAGSSAKMLEFLCRPQLDTAAWTDNEFLKSYLDYIAPRMGVREKSDWNRISNKLLARQPGGNGLIRHVGLLPALEAAYPEEDWKAMKLQLASKKASQWNLAHVVGHLFPCATVVEEYGLGVDGMQLDVFVVEHNLAFEYQGRQHYEETGIMGPLQAIQERDARKVQLAEEKGLRLIHIPFWWDDKKGSLAALLHSRYPGLLAASIEYGRGHLDMVDDSRRAEAADSIGHLVQLVTRLEDGRGPQPIPAEPQERRATAWSTIDPAGMWMTDGTSSAIAASWTKDRCLVSKGSMRRIRDAPAEWKHHLPPSALDGRLALKGGNMMGLIHKVFRGKSVPKAPSPDDQPLLDRFGQPRRTSS